MMRSIIVYFIVLIMRNFYPSALNVDWYWYLLGMVVFSIPGLIASYKQFKSGYSLEGQIDKQTI